MKNNNRLAFLYIAAETAEVLNEQKTYELRVQTDYIKIGNCNGILHDRLRLLNQGNPRQLVMAALYIGPAADITALETAFKDEHNAIGGYGRTEWYRMDPTTATQLVERKIASSRLFSSIRKITDQQVLPYRWSTHNNCPFNGRERLNEVYKNADGFNEIRANTLKNVIEAHNLGFNFESLDKSEVNRLLDAFYLS